MADGDLMAAAPADPAEGGLVLGVRSSLGGRRWLWRDSRLADAGGRIGLMIAQQAGVSELVGQMLAARGLDGGTAATFLDPTLRALMPDPSALQDMDVAAERLAEAVRRGETVAVFGDYDVDGACAAALVTGLLRQLGCPVMTHVPDRMTEGYGPNAPALDALVGRGATLVVCVDCGTAAGDVLATLAGRADIVVLDHHKAEGPPPSVLATVNPNRPDCLSGQRGLCAAGVAFLTAVATVRALRRAGWFAGRPEPDLMAFLDIVALATVCDVMPLTGLNRALVTQGLKMLARRRRIGLEALLEVAGARDPLSAFTCGFALGPRINAGGRIAESGLGLDLLLCDDAAEARRLAERLDAVNRRRQTVETAILDRAMEEAAAQRAAGHAVLVLSGRDWHAGVVGIVAGRIKERFNRPVLVGAELEDGTIKGSGRSVAEIDLGAAIIAARQMRLLTTGGGHAMAAGFSLPAGGVPALHDFLNERLRDAAALPDAVDVLIEGVVHVAGATVALATDIGRMAPFGAGNDEPVLAIPRVRVVRADRIGREGGTLRVLVEGEGGGPRLKALLFRADDHPAAAMLEDRNAPPLHLAGWLRAENWNGRTDASFFIRDAAVAS
ncbi:single-stranded-DNA-specific exonuclease RecJ [Gluconacetobacter takamatsuzukensis]|uniref:Single-stranded-DNA-specific exonuclease RecJ n=1 Tax=Gluconacetobacter takamatsuzukensis TaxID=1286190 RepID=A0A7W4KEZ2_9PROT|nr:single-stranded-DNA-specific exonuclease RecJ [Gluconacetobacter takamatsuzukensis]MBB2205668.1 single-stranded-DNA-specific exonuclease RecJ [Gluconacetobacter takamatsuzukensis]